MCQLQVKSSTIVRAFPWNLKMHKLCLNGGWLGFPLFNTVSACPLGYSLWEEAAIILVQEVA